MSQQPNVHPPLDALHSSLAHTLGFVDYPNDRTFEPYLDYIRKGRSGDSEEQYIELLIDTIGYFKGPALIVRIPDGQVGGALGDNATGIGAAAGGGDGNVGDVGASDHNDAARDTGGGDIVVGDNTAGEHIATSERNMVDDDDATGGASVTEGANEAEVSDCAAGQEGSQGHSCVNVDDHAEGRQDAEEYDITNGDDSAAGEDSAGPSGGLFPRLLHAFSSLVIQVVYPEKEDHGTAYELVENENEPADGINTEITDNNEPRLDRDVQDNGTGTEHAQNTNISIQALFDKLSNSPTIEFFQDTTHGSARRRGDVEDEILLMLGAWSLLKSSFVRTVGVGRKVILAYNQRHRVVTSESKPYEEDLAGLLAGSGLLSVPDQHARLQHMVYNSGTVQTIRRTGTLFRRGQTFTNLLQPDIAGPQPSRVGDDARAPLPGSWLHSLDSLERLLVDKTQLNIYTLMQFGAVDIILTQNISRHLLLSRQGTKHIVEIFSLPCSFKGSTLTSKAVGIDTNLITEIQDSYASLINPWPVSSRHTWLVETSRLGRFCPCRSCSAQRHWQKIITDDKSHISDPYLDELIRKDSGDWMADLYPCLWQRIMILEDHLQAAKPWNVWELYQDRRDTLQFWTFIFATTVVFLTVLQVLLGFAQVATSFAH